MTPEVQARRTLAAVVVADFDHEAADFANGGRIPDWLAWSHRLATAVRGLVEALASAEIPPVGATRVLPSTAIYIAPSDAPVVAALVAEGAALDRTGNVQRVARALRIGGTR
jgi:hypothetical protein